MARNGSMTKDPKATNKQAPPPTGPSKWVRTGAGQYKDQYGNTMRGQQKAPTRDMSKGKGGNTAPVQGPAAPTPESVTEEGFMGAGQAYQNMLQRFGGEQYQPQFEQEMERARQNVMGQFERRNNQAFAQQRQDFETTMANKGVAPGSQQYQLELKSLNDRQDMARQEAMGAAEQAAYGVQQQQFGQAGDLAMRPYEQWGVLQQPYMAGIGAQYQAREAQLQRDFEDAMRRGDRASAERIAGMARRGGGGGAPQMSEYEILERNSLNTGYPGKQPNTGAQVVGGVVQGVGGQITNRLNR
jgi:hypothetical protein